MTGMYGTAEQTKLNSEICKHSEEIKINGYSVINNYINDIANPKESFHTPW